MENIENEIWVPVFDPNFKDHYEVSNLGRIRRVRYKHLTLRYKLLRPSSGGANSEYRYISFYTTKNNINKKYRLNRLVYFSFNLDIDPTLLIHHKDGNKKNDNLNNLESVTASENIRYSYATGNHRSQKINTTEYINIKELHLNGISQKEISKIYGVARHTISRILNQKLNLFSKSFNLTLDQHKTIVKLYKEGKSKTQISHIMKTSVQNVFHSLKYNLSEEKPKQILTKHVDQNNILWKPIIIDKIGYPYFINSDGNIKNIDGKLMKQSIDRDGYKRIRLGKCKERCVHRLVSIIFIPNPENKPLVHHKDKNRQNNQISNLEWATAKENSQFRHRVEKTQIVKNVPKIIKTN